MLQFQSCLQNWRLADKGVKEKGRRMKRSCPSPSPRALKYPVSGLIPSYTYPQRGEVIIFKKKSTAKLIVVLLNLNQKVFQGGSVLCSLKKQKTKKKQLISFNNNKGLKYRFDWKLLFSSWINSQNESNWLFFPQTLPLFKTLLQ